MEALFGGRWTRNPLFLPYLWNSVGISISVYVSGYLVWILDSASQAFQQHKLSVKLWPPSQSTRLMLVERMTKNPITPSIFSRKYGHLGKEEAEEDAMQIEELAFTAANQHYEKDVRAFEALLKSQNNLEELCFINDGTSGEAARAVCELIPSTKKLKVLHFHNNLTGDEGAVAIAEMVKPSPALEDFRRSSTRIGSEGGVALAEPLGTCTHLKKLDLRDNMFGVEAGLALSTALSAFPDLTEIYLCHLNLEDEEAEALANALKEFAPPLEVWELEIGWK